MFVQIHATVEGHSTDAEAPLQAATPGQAHRRRLVKVGVGSMILVGAALIFVVAPVTHTSSDLSDVMSLAMFTSPYYKTGKPCPEGELVPQDECKHAGALLGYGNK